MGSAFHSFTPTGTTCATCESTTCAEELAVGTEIAVGTPVGTPAGTAIGIAESCCWGTEVEGGGTALAALEARRRMQLRRITQPARIARAQTPPTHPPAMAATGAALEADASRVPSGAVGEGGGGNGGSGGESGGGNGGAGGMKQPAKGEHSAVHLPGTSAGSHSSPGRKQWNVGTHVAHSVGTCVQFPGASSAKILLQLQGTLPTMRSATSETAPMSSAVMTAEAELPAVAMSQTQAATSDAEKEPAESTGPDTSCSKHTGSAQTLVYA